MDLYIWLRVVWSLDLWPYYCQNKNRARCIVKYYSKIDACWHHPTVINVAKLRFKKKTRNIYNRDITYQSYFTVIGPFSGRRSQKVLETRLLTERIAKPAMGTLGLYETIQNIPKWKIINAVITQAWLWDYHYILDVKLLVSRPKTDIKGHPHAGTVCFNMTRIQLVYTVESCIWTIA